MKLRRLLRVGSTGLDLWSQKLCLAMVLRCSDLPCRRQLPWIFDIRKCF